MVRTRRRRGFSLIELSVSFTILMMLTGMAVPLARYRVRREKERDLRLALREIHAAIDKYKDACDYGQLGAESKKLDSECYPETLEALVEGVKAAGAQDKKIKFLRRIPRDPFTGNREWGMRSVKDDPTSSSWGGSNVFSVYSKTYEKAGDGTAYSEW